MNNSDMRDESAPENAATLAPQSLAHEINWSPAAWVPGRRTDQTRLDTLDVICNELGNVFAQIQNHAQYIPEAQLSPIQKLLRKWNLEALNHLQILSNLKHGSASLEPNLDSSVNYTEKADLFIRAYQKQEPTIIQSVANINALLQTAQSPDDGLTNLLKASQ